MTDLSARIVRAAAQEARLHGLPHITRSGVAQRAGVPTGSLSHHMGGATLTDIKRLVVEKHPSLAAASLDRPTVVRADRDERILAAAMLEAQSVGWQRFTRAGVAARAGLSAGSVSNYGAPTLTERQDDPMGKLRDAVMRRAVEQGLAGLVAQGLAAGDAVARAAPADLREQAMALACAQ